jgi:TolB-like protein
MPIQHKSLIRRNPNGHRLGGRGAKFGFWMGTVWPWRVILTPTFADGADGLPDTDSIPSESGGLIQQLRVRKVFQWTIAYAAGAWVVLQGIGLLGDFFEWSNLVGRMATVVLAIGILGAIVLAWYHGEKGAQRAKGLELVLLGAIVIAATGAALMVRKGAPATATAGNNRKTIAVLPFANLSTNQENAQFASGIHDEVLTQLAKLGDLKVISRTSVLSYGDGSRNLKQIGRELGAGVIVEGSVQRVDNRVKVQAQLIDANTDEHLWAETYNRDLTDVFAIQSDIAQQIANALQARLTSVERKRLAARPTENAEAYDAYLQARDYHRRPGRLAQNYRAAERLYAQAINLDQNFALAHAELADVHAQMYWFRIDRSEMRRAQMKSEAEAALTLQPRLPEGHRAMALYWYWAYRDYNSALAELKIAERGLPGDVGVHSTIAAILRRRGLWQESIDRFMRVTALDPRNSLSWYELCNTLQSVRRFADALTACTRGRALAPDDYNIARRIGELELERTGKADAWRALFADSVLNRTTDPDLPYDRFQVALYSRDFAEAEAAVNAMPGGFNLQSAYVPAPLAMAWVHQMRGNRPAALSAFERARVLADSAARAQHDEPIFHLALGFAYAGLGRSDDAAREADLAMRLLPVEKDALAGTENALVASQVLAQAGRTDEAIALLERLKDVPEGPSPTLLRLDPRWDPLRADPRFQALLVR